jgi:integrase
VSPVWLEHSVRPNRRPNTYRNYELIVRRHIIPQIGHVRLDRISPEDVAFVYGQMERAGRSGRTRELAHVVLRRALSEAVRYGRIPYNPAVVG